MVTPRHRIPTPAWAELPVDSVADDTVRPIAGRAFFGRTVASIGSATFGSWSETQPILRDDDSDAPKASAV
jgi:hypothetical protein